MAIDKLVVSDRQNLLAKYGSDLSLIQAAVSKWIQADWVKGIQSKLVYLDVVADVGLNGMAVVSGTEKEFKDVIDAFFKEHTPDYLVIRGAPDIVPHQTLTNPAENDGDDTIPSDLPYAGDAPFGDNPCTFLGASRVVGRLPDLNGVKDAPYLVGLIE